MIAASSKGGHKKNHPRKLSHFELVSWPSRKCRGKKPNEDEELEKGKKESIKKKMVHFDDRFHTHLMIITLESLVSLLFSLFASTHFFNLQLYLTFNIDFTPPFIADDCYCYWKKE